MSKNSNETQMKLKSKEKTHIMCDLADFMKIKYNTLVKQGTESGGRFL